MDSLDPVRLAAMAIAENYAALHDMISGEVAHFVRQGFTTEQARAMAAAEFVSTFGAAIGLTATRPGDE